MPYANVDLDTHVRPLNEMMMEHGRLSKRSQRSIHTVQHAVQERKHTVRI